MTLANILNVVVGNEKIMILQSNTGEQYRGLRSDFDNCEKASELLNRDVTMVTHDGTRLVICIR